jgi:hypothetical protein
MPSFKSIPIIFGKLRRWDQMVPPQHFRAPKSPVQIGLTFVTCIFQTNFQNTFLFHINFYICNVSMLLKN